MTWRALRLLRAVKAAQEAEGSGNGPRYVTGPVHVDPGGGDPYDLDRDGDGTGCE
jgi:hypothetical protein